jgi:pimeloyl-ACP methyl ester carboxylesterase
MKADLLAANRPGARYLRFENAGHGIYRQRPETLFAVLRDFLERLESRRSESL